MKSLKNLFNADQFLVGHGALTPLGMAQRSQDVLDQFIEENGVKLHGFYHKNGPTGAWTTSIVASTHTGILLDIQPLKQCEHKEAVYVEVGPLSYIDSPNNKASWFKCRDCGKPVKAKGWEAV